MSNLEDLQKIILNDASYAIIATDTDGLIEYFNPAAEKMLGYQRHEIVGKETPLFFHDHQEVIERAALFSKELNEPLTPGFDVFVVKSRLGLPNKYEWTYIKKDRSCIPVSLSVSALRNSQNKIIGYLGIASDISQEVRNRYDLALVRDQLNTAARIAKLGIWIWTIADNALVWNDRMYEIYQQPMELRDKGLKYTHWSSRLHPEDAEATELALKNAVEGKGVYDRIFRIILPDGSIRYIKAGGQIERDKTGKTIRVTGFNMDITEQYEYERNLQEMVYIDALTNIPNRRSFDENIKTDLRHARRVKKPLALLLIDVDYFKLYNDRFGHQAGDACLQKIAATIKHNLYRPRDIVTRYGGEEFACLLPETSKEGAREIGERLCNAVYNLQIR